MKMNKIIFTIFIVVFFLIIVSFDVFAWKGNEKEIYISSSEEKIILSTGAILPYWYEFNDKRDNNQQKRAYLFKAMEDDIKEILLYDGSPFYTIQYGQWIYFPVNNSGDPLDTSPLKNASNAIKQFEVKSNVTDEAWGYVNKYGQQFYTKFPNNPIIPSNKRGITNTNFKVETINVPTKVFSSPKIDPKKQFFISADGTNLLGNVRNVWNHVGNTTGFFQFAPDNLSNPTAGWRIYASNRLIKYPHKDKYGLTIEQGYYNELAKGLTQEEKTSNNPIWKNILNTYAVLRAEYPGVVDRMKDLGAGTDLKSQTEKFLEYAEMQFLSAVDSPGIAYVKGNMGTASKPDVWLAGLVSPEVKLSEINNLRVGSEEFKIGDNYNVKLIDLETNKILKSKEDKLVAGRRYILDYNVVFETTKPLKEKTNNAPILTNVFIYYNENSNSNQADVAFHNISDINNLPYLEKVNKENNILNVSKFEEDKMNINKIANYKQEIEILASTKDGLKTDKVKICAVLPYQYDFYKTFEGDSTKGDNDDTVDDITCLDFEVRNQTSNTFVGFKETNSIAKHNSQNYDRIEIRKYDKNGQLANVVVNNETTLSGKVAEGDKIMITTYVQRSDIPDMPRANDNPVKISEIALKMNETANAQTRELKDRDTYNSSTKLYSPTIYKAGYTEKLPTLTHFAQYNPQTKTHGSWTQYNASTHKDLKFEAGMILRFDLVTNVPKTTEIINVNNSQYDGYYKLGDSAVFKKWGIMMELIIYNQQLSLINSIRTDDWSKVILDVVGEQPNMSITEVLIKDENNAVVATATRTASGEVIISPSKVVLDPKKNYYIEGKTIYENKPNEKSINSNLKTAFQVSYNGLPAGDINTTRFFAESDLKQQWLHNQTGTYRPNLQPSQSSVNIANYYPSQSSYLPVVKEKPTNLTVSPWNPLVMPIKFLNVEHGVVRVQIPSQYSNNDNMLKKPLQYVEIPFIVDNKKNIDNAITSIKLYDYSHKLYDKKNSDGTYILDPFKQYYAVIEIERLQGEGDKIINPTLEVDIRLDQNTKGRYPAKIISSNNTLEKVGDKIQYQINNLASPNGFIQIEAFLPHVDIEMANNKSSSTWIGYYNFAVSDFQLNPQRLQRGENEPAVKSTVSFTVEVSFTNYIKDLNLPNYDLVAKQVPIEIRDSSNRIVYREIFDLENGTTQIAGQFKTEYIFKDGANPFTIAINGGKTGSFYMRKYVEWSPDKKPYEDNEDINSIIVEGPPPKSEACFQDCSSHNTENNWTQTFKMVTMTGRSPKTIYYTCCSGDPSSCSTCSMCICEGAGNLRTWETTPSFTEKFTISAVWFKSPTTIDKYGDKFINIKGSQEGVVRAGQWYEFYIETTFYTNREEQSYGGLTPPAWSTACGCNYQRRNPGQTSIANVESIHVNITGYGSDECYPSLKPYQTNGRWSNQKKLFRVPQKTDAMGETRTRRYIPVTGKNGTINLSIVTKPFIGYVTDFDKGHPDYASRRSSSWNYVWNPTTNRSEWVITHNPPYRHQLQDCVSARIYVKDPLPFQTQIIGE